MSVKINSLELENIKRVQAVQLEPTKDGLTVIGGRNGQGKTSVLDAITWALGGGKYKPDNPNREGANTPAKLKVELDNGIIVERQGKSGTLRVTDVNGGKGGQALLDAFISQLALDLPRFMMGSDADKATALLQTLGIDEELSTIDEQIRSTYQDRQLVGRDAKSKRMYADNLPFYNGVPHAPVVVSDLVHKQQAILEQNSKNQSYRMQAVELDRQARQAEDAKITAEQQICEIKNQLEKAQAYAAHVAEQAQKARENANLALKQAQSLIDQSTEEIENEIASAEMTNNQVLANKAKQQALQAAVDAENEYTELTNKLETLRKSRIALLDNSPLPLADLSINDDGKLIYRGQTWGSMSGSEQLCVATAIVRATKPECGFVLIDKLEQMDSQTLSEFGAWAKNQGLQVIGTRVATDDTCNIIIEDGCVADKPASQQI